MRKSLLIFLLIISFSSSFSQVKLDSGLVVYYPFNGNANDSSGNGNNAIFNNASLTNDRFGNPNSAYSFNGVDNYIQIPNSISLNTGSQISLCAYVKVNGFYNGPCHGNDIINKGQYQGNSNFYFIRFDDNAYTNGANCSNPIVDTIHQNFYSNDAIVASPGYSPYINEGQWYCLVYTYDGAATKFYIDGALITQTSVSGLIASNSDDLYLGRLFYPSDPSLFPYWFNGVMDEVRIYNRAIDSQEVAALCPSAVTLPVTITKFATSIVNKQIKLDWNVENEDGILKYTVERSLTGRSDFVPVGSIAAKKLSGYSFVDNTATNVNQNYYYRLAILENTNQVSYSEIKTARIISGNNILVIYPNPSKGNITVKINGYEGTAKFTILNSIGQIVLNESNIINDNRPLTLKLNSQSKGIYWLRVETMNEQFVEKILLY